MPTRVSERDISRGKRREGLLRKSRFWYGPTSGLYATRPARAVEGALKFLHTTMAGATMHTSTLNTGPLIVSHNEKEQRGARGPSHSQD